jgi:hypothetical protein
MNKLTIPALVADVLNVWNSAADKDVYDNADIFIEKNGGYNNFFRELKIWIAQIEKALYMSFERDEAPAGLLKQVTSLNCISGTLAGIDNTIKDLDFSPFATDRAMAFAIAMFPAVDFDGREFGEEFEAVTFIRDVPRNP